MLLPGPHPFAGGLVGDGSAKIFVDASLGEQITGLLRAGLITTTADEIINHSAS